jgi:hypothetical protein
MLIATLPAGVALDLMKTVSPARKSANWMAFPSYPSRAV